MRKTESYHQVRSEPFDLAQIKANQRKVALLAHMQAQREAMKAIEARLIAAQHELRIKRETSPDLS